MKNLLVISDDILKQEKRRIWKRALAIIILLLISGLVMLYASLTASEVRHSTIYLKETVGTTDYIYIEMNDHLLKLECGPNVDFKSISADDQIYQLRYKWNLLTYTGIVSRCEKTNMIQLGTLMDEIGSEFDLDPGVLRLDFKWETGPFDVLFGFDRASCELLNRYPAPTGDGYLSTYLFRIYDGTDHFSLETEDIRSFIQADWDGDGVTELLVRTRWPEKPYTIYDYNNDEIVASWPETIPEEFSNRLAS